MVEATIGVQPNYSAASLGSGCSAQPIPKERIRVCDFCTENLAQIGPLILLRPESRNNPRNDAVCTLEKNASHENDVD